MDNYTVAHESQKLLRDSAISHPYRLLRFPDDHIEVDNRLSYFLGTLHKEYGDGAYYVHLLRNQHEVARSLAGRDAWSILFAFASGVLQYRDEAQFLTEEQRYEIGLHYWDTINDNIQMFLRDKSHYMTMWIHDIKDAFADFWYAIDGKGDLQAAISEWDVRHNIGKTGEIPTWLLTPWAHRVAAVQEEIVATVPAGKTLILVDNEELRPLLVIADRLCAPFVERDGQYWGPPTNDKTAISELERLRLSGAGFIVFAWPAFWWLDHYTAFAEYLRSGFPCVVQNERLIVFDIRGTYSST